MAIDTLGSSTLPPSQSSNARAKQTPASDRASLQAAQQRQILVAQENVTIRSGDQSLQLTLRAAIDAINERLAPTLGENALQQGVDSGLDVSPEATAARIVALTTGLFTRFQQANPNLDSAQQAERFTAILRDGVEQGFAEAREVLDGLGVLQGDIASNIDLTYDLVQQGLNQFLARFDGNSGDSGAIASNAGEPDSPT
ncbi:DUF5610 domain-containing protein [Motiliproteus sediminis]|uniref:DUF5610 domain-containing protein n=1 Tax=Motiliproteus sediminis TaxID=1468178 RepID=UPI001AEFB41E|nr:DUF5610 domain-containing protein [Motiliproteus sediminis]